MEIRDNLIAEFKKIDQLRINEGLEENADDVGLVGGNAGRSFLRLTFGLRLIFQLAVFLCRRRLHALLRHKRRLHFPIN